MSEKDQLIRELETLRGDLSQQWQAASQALSPTHLVQDSLRKHKLAWFSAAGAGGLLASRLLWPGRKNRRDISDASDKTAGIFSLLTAPLFKVARQQALKHGTQLLQDALLQSLARRTKAQTAAETAKTDRAF